MKRSLEEISFIQSDQNDKPLILNDEQSEEVSIVDTGNFKMPDIAVLPNSMVEACEVGKISPDPFEDSYFCKLVDLDSFSCEF